VASRIAGAWAVCHHERVPTVLIVDDHPSFRASARAILEAEGFEIAGEAEDGESAIDAVHLLHSYRRLRTVKAAFDPQNVFRANHPILPPA
jgi:CheY-like chemotaxis protein